MKIKTLFYKREFQVNDWGAKPVWVMRDWWLFVSAALIAGAVVSSLVLISRL